MSNFSAVVYIHVINIIKMLFSLSNVGDENKCERTDSITCTQENRGEKRPPYTKRNVLYENICILCNPGASENKISTPEHPPSIYVGESSKSLYEHGRKHWRDFRTNQGFL